MNSNPTNIEVLQSKHTKTRYFLPRFPFKDLELLFGYYDGSKAVVEIQTEGTAASRRRTRLRNGHSLRSAQPSQGVVLRGDLLLKVCAAALYLTGHDIQPSLRSLGLRVRDCGPTEIVVDTQESLHKRENAVPVHAMVSSSERTEGLRFWIQCGPLWQNYDLDKAQTTAFIDRLTEAADWPISGEDKS